MRVVEEVIWGKKARRGVFQVQRGIYCEIESGANEIGVIRVGKNVLGKGGNLDKNLRLTGREFQRRGAELE